MRRFFVLVFVLVFSQVLGLELRRQLDGQMRFYKKKSQGISGLVVIPMRWVVERSNA